MDKLDWKCEIEDGENIKMWNTSSWNNYKFLVYSVLETENMNAQVEASITKYHPKFDKSEIVYFHRMDKSGLLDYLSKWIGITTELKKKQLESLI